MEGSIFGGIIEFFSRSTSLTVIGFGILTVLINILVRTFLQQSILEAITRLVRWGEGKPVIGIIAKKLAYLKSETPEELHNLRRSIRDSRERKVKSKVQREGFQWVSSENFESGHLDRENCWHRPFTLREIAEGFAVDRQRTGGERDEVAEELLSNLTNGGSAVLLGSPGSGKTTICKMVINRWWESETLGPILYHRKGSSSPFENTVELTEAIEHAKQEGDTLVVVEDATRESVRRIFEVIPEFQDDEKVSFLLNSRTHQWESFENSANGEGILDLRSDVGEQAIHIRQQVIQKSHVPELDKEEIERFIKKFEDVTGRGVVFSSEQVFRRIQHGRGVSPLLLLSYHLPQDSLDDSIKSSSLRTNIKFTFNEIRSGELTPDGVSDERFFRNICLMINILNATEIGVKEELLHSLATTRKEHEQIDMILHQLEGKLLFGKQEEYGWWSHHELWSVQYLRQYLEEAPSERSARSQFEDCVNALFRIVEDRSLQKSVIDWFGSEEPLTEIRENKTGVANYLVMRIFDLGEENPILSPLFGTSDHTHIELPKVCEDSVVGNMYIKRAEMLKHRGEMEAARKELEKGREHVKGGSDSSRVEAVFAIQIGNLESDLSNLESAEEHFQRGLKISREEGYQREVGCFLNNMSRIYNRRGDYRLAEEYLDEALDIAEEREDLVEKSNCLNGLGGIAFERSAYSDAKEFFARSLEIENELGDKSRIADRLNNLGAVARDTGDVGKADEYINESIRLKKDLGEYSDVASKLINLGGLYTEIGEYDLAEQKYKKAREIASDSGNTNRLAGAVNGLATLSTYRGNVKEAKELYQNALELAEDADNGSAVSSNYEGLGNIALIEEDSEQAQEFFKSALDSLNKSEKKEDKARIEFNLANAKLVPGEYDSAREICLRSLKTYEKIGDRSGQANAQIKLATIEQAKGNSEREIEHREESIDLLIRSDNFERALEEMSKITQSYLYIHQEDKAANWSQRAVELVNEKNMSLLSSPVHHALIQKAEFMQDDERISHLYNLGIQLAVLEQLNGATQAFSQLWSTRDTDSLTPQQREKVMNAGVLLATSGLLATEDADVSVIIDQVDRKSLSESAVALYEYLTDGTAVNPDTIDPDPSTDEVDIETAQEKVFAVYLRTILDNQ